jgi:tetratricopeptide (TPR) repeat protein
MKKLPRLIHLLVAACLLAAPAFADDPAESQLQIGIAQIRLKKFEDARKPLEVAFETAKTPRVKLNAAESLMRVYRETSKVEDFLEAADYVIAHNERKAGRSVNGSQVGAFVRLQGKTDDAIKRYEKKLSGDPKDLVALVVLSEIYARSDRPNKDRATELTAKLVELEKEIATGHARRLEKAAETDAAVAAWNLKDAAQFWLEAGEQQSALAAAKKSLDASPEIRSQILTYQWREALGDIFLQAGETKQALRQFEAAAKSAPEGILKTNVEKKADQARGQSK